jgi:hypothetical protein
MIDLEFRPSPPWNVITIEHFPLHFFGDAVPVFVPPRDFPRRELPVWHHVIPGPGMSCQTKHQEGCECDPIFQRRDGMVTLRYGKKVRCECFSSAAGGVFHPGGHQSFHCALDLFVDRSDLHSVAGNVGRYQRQSGNHWGCGNVVSAHASLVRVGTNRSAVRCVSRERSGDQHGNDHRRARCSNVAALGAAPVSIFIGCMGLPGLRATSKGCETEPVGRRPCGHAPRFRATSADTRE